MTFKPSLDREVGEIHTKVEMILKIAERDSGRIDRLEASNNRRVGRNGFIAAVFGLVSGVGSNFLSKYL